jgi:ribosomal protein S18 acetylase RimI-like enzyme
MSTRAKQKKAQIKQETEMLNKKRAQIAECEEIEDPLALVPVFKTFDRNGIKGSLVAAKKCPEELEEFAFNLIEKHMKDIYEETWGWDPDAKAAELYEPSARFIFAVPDADPPYPLAFIHYRFEMNDAVTAAYIYDVHVADEAIRKGLGKLLVQAVEFISLKLKLDAVLVTVFKANQGGFRFFQNLKYIPHSSSPSISDRDSAHEYHHEILYKSLVKKTA